MNTTVTIKSDGSELTAFLKRLSSELVDLPKEFRKPAFMFFKIKSDLVRFECRTTARAEVTILLKPSQRLLDFETAIRAGNFNFFTIEDPQ